MPEANPDIAASLAYLLTDDSDVADMVSDRVYPVSGEQDETRPYIVYMLESDENPMSQDGAANLTKSQFVVWCVGDVYADAKRLANFVRVRLAGFRGSVGVHSIQGIFPVTKDDTPIPPRSGKERAESEVAARYRIAWVQSPAAIGAT